MLNTGTQEVTVLSYHDWEIHHGPNEYQEYVEEQAEAMLPHMTQAAWLRREGQQAYSLYTERLSQDAAGTGLLLNWPNEHTHHDVSLASNEQDFDWQLQEALRRSDVRPISCSRY